MRQFLALIKQWAFAIFYWFKGLPLWLKYGLVALLFAALAAAGVWRWGLRQQIDAGLLAKDTNAQPYVENLWFLPDGTLVGTRQSSDGRVVISIWHTKGQSLVSEQKTFDLGAIEDQMEQQGLYPGFDGRTLRLDRSL